MFEKQDPLRILQVNQGDLSIGANLCSWNLFRAYGQAGVDSWLAVGDKRSQDPDVFRIPADPHQPAWVRRWRATCLRNSRRSKWALRLSRLAYLGEPQRLWDHLRGIEDFNFSGTWKLLDLPPRRPNIVHCHNLHCDYFDLRILPWLSAQVPVIINLHDAWMLSGHCAHSLGCERWRTGCGQCPDLTIYRSVRGDATAYNWRRKKEIFSKSRLYVTAVSTWLMNKARETMFPDAPGRVIPNGIDLEIFFPGDREAARRKLNLPLDAEIVLMSAHNPFKNLPFMKSVMARIANRSASRKLLFLCISREPPNELELGQGRIRFIDIVHDRRTMASLYQAADVYFHAAVEESFGNAVAEAMACGTPVVVATGGGAPEALSSDATGFLIHPSDEAGAVRALQRLLDDAGLRERMGRTARTHAAERFGLERQVKEFLKWYPEVRRDWADWKRRGGAS